MEHLIGQQGASNNPINNIWDYPLPTGNAYQTVTLAGTPTHSVMHVNDVPTIPATRPTLNTTATNPPFPYLFNAIPQSIFTTTATASTTCLSAPGSWWPWWINDLGSINTIAGTGVAFASQSANLNYVGKQMLYDLQLTDSGYATASTPLSTFYASSNASTSNYRKMKDIEDAINSGNFSNAQILVNAFVPANTVETNQKNYYNIAIAFGSSGALSETNRANLQAIATLCPHYNGRAVYDARLLYNIYTATNGLASYPFYDDCNGTGLYKKADTALQNFGQDVRLYPNPNNGNFYLDFDNKNIQTAQIKITDMAGRDVYNNTVSLINGYALCTSNLAPGVYIINLFAKGQAKTVKKIIVE